MGDGHINTTPETETISVETLVSNPSESDDFSLGECNLFDIDDSYYEKSTTSASLLAQFSPEIVEVCVDDDDTDDDDDYDDDFYDSVDNGRRRIDCFRHFQDVDKFSSGEIRKDKKDKKKQKQSKTDKERKRQDKDVKKNQKSKEPRSADTGKKASQSQNESRPRMTSSQMNLNDGSLFPVPDLFSAMCGVFQNLQDTSESSNDNTNVVNAPREPSVVDQDPGTPPVASMEMLHAQTDLIEAMQNFLKKYDHIPHNEKSIKSMLAEGKFFEDQTKISNQIQKDQEEKNIVELLAEERLQKANQALNESQSPQEMRIQDLEIQKQQCLEEMKEWMNDLGIREYQKEKIDIDYRRKCEDKIYELKDKFNGLSIEIRKIIQEAEELRKSEARARIQKIIVDDDDDNLGFYAVHPNTIHTPVSQNVEPKDSFIMGDGHINTTPETETISVETLVSNPSESDDFSLGECNCSTSMISNYEKVPELDLLILLQFRQKSLKRRRGEIDFDFLKIVDTSLTEKLKEADVPSFSDDSILRGIESDRDSGEDTTSIDALPLDDSMILSEYESFTFDDEPVMAEVNVFDEINTSELSYPGIGENVVSDEEEDTFTYSTRTFLPFVTYPEVLPVSYSTGSEDKIFNPGIFDNDAFKDKSSKELAPSKALLTLDVFDPLHPPLMDFHVTKAFSGFIFSLLKIFSKKFFEPGIKNALVYLSSLVWGGFPDFGSFMVQILWKDKAIPTISIDGLQSSLHNLGNLLSLFFIELTSILLA
ncbi:hypothetical protein Tco_0010914 [Tanacetum coccineum]